MLQSISTAISQEYQSLYETTHHRRFTACERAIDRVRGQEGWEVFAQSGGGSGLLNGLLLRQCQEPETSEAARAHRVAFNEDGVLCVHCRASISQMESDQLAVDTLEKQAISRFLELTAPATSDNSRTTIRRVRAAQYFGATLDSEQSVDEALNNLREELVKLLAQGASIIVE